MSPNFNMSSRESNISLFGDWPVFCYSSRVIDQSAEVRSLNHAFEARKEPREGFLVRRTRFMFQRSRWFAEEVK